MEFRIKNFSKVCYGCGGLFIIFQLYVERTLFDILFKIYYLQARILIFIGVAQNLGKLLRSVVPMVRLHADLH